MRRPVLGRDVQRGRNRLISIAAFCVVIFSGHASDKAFGEIGRKARHSKIVPPSRTAPDITATIPKAAPKPSAPPKMPDDDALPAPFNLPNAPRSKMRACGEQWESIKLTGHAGSVTWREFATKCLAATAEPARTIP